MDSDELKKYLKFGLGIPLIVWGGVNTLAGGLYFIISSEICKGIIIQSFFWGFIDLILGLFAFFNKKDLNPYKIRKILLINTFLDIVYIVGGVILGVFSARMLFVGSGYGVIIQGLFLFCADLIHYLKFRQY